MRLFFSVLWLCTIGVVLGGSLQCVPCNDSSKLCMRMVDYCDAIPCYNGGTCSNLARGVRCTCPTAFWGSYCQFPYSPPRIAIDLPEVSYAVPGSEMPSLVVTAIDGEPPLTYTWYIDGWPVRDADSPEFNVSLSDVMLVPWYTSIWCEVRDARYAVATSNRTVLNPYCLSPTECLCSPECQNGGTCLEGSTCVCTDEYTGQDCGVRRDPCKADASPCSDRGVCVPNDPPVDYSCNCTVGWQGAHCEEDTDECSQSAPCRNGATCNNTIGSFECLCAAGFQGALCDQDVDECASAGTCLHGSCVNTFGGFQCVCESGYRGDRCEADINECAENVTICNHGSCQNLDGSYDCACFSGYVSDNCEVDLCAGNPCNNGTCFRVQGGMICSCDTCAFGASCDSIDGCCAHSGVCNSGLCNVSTADPYYTCTCGAGYTGPTCSVNIDECASSPCLHGATCVDGVNGYTCSCASGYTGTHCETEINECAPTPCLNGATCTDLVGAFNCTCAGGYIGTRCEVDIDECASAPCQHGATCADFVNRFECYCVSGWVGTLCQTDFNECASSPCANSGSCTQAQPGPGFVCDCPVAFSGPLCASCNSALSYANCSSSCVQTTTNADHCGTCGHNCTAAHASTRSCVNSVCVYTCMPGWSGTTCDVNINECASNPCRNGGTCTDLVNGFNCTCVDPFMGAVCEHDMTATLTASAYDAFVGDTVAFSLSNVGLTGTHDVYVNNTLRSLNVTFAAVGESTVRDCLRTQYGTRCYNLGGYGNVRVWPSYRHKTVWTTPGSYTVRLSTLFDPVYSTHPRVLKLWGAGGTPGWHRDGAVPMCGSPGGYAEYVVSATAASTQTATLAVGAAHSHPVGDADRTPRLLSGAVEKRPYGIYTPMIGNDWGNNRGGIGGDASAVILHEENLSSYVVLAVAGGGGGGADDSGLGVPGVSRQPMLVGGSLVFAAGAFASYELNEGLLGGHTNPQIPRDLWERVPMLYGMDALGGAAGFVFGGGSGGGGAGAGPSSARAGGTGGGLFSANSITVSSQYDTSCDLPAANFALVANSGDIDYPAGAAMSSPMQGTSASPQFPLGHGAIVAVAREFPAQNCTPGLTGIRCDTCLCTNGGNCTASGLWTKDRTTSVCTCPSRWAGLLCEIDLEPCLNLPCLNGGTCQNLPAGAYQCTCPSSNGFKLWFGTRCDIPAQSGLRVNETTLEPVYMNAVSEAMGDFDGVPLTAMAAAPRATFILRQLPTPALAPFRLVASYVSLHTWHVAQFDMFANGSVGLIATNRLGLTSETVPVAWVLLNDTRFCRYNAIVRRLEDDCYSSVVRSPRCTKMTIHDDGELFVEKCDGTEWYFRRIGSTAVSNGCMQDQMPVCQNGGTCTNGVQSFTCTCPRGYTGPKCEININECGSSPCANGGTCNDGVASYTCSCYTIPGTQFVNATGATCATAQASSFGATPTAWSGYSEFVVNSYFLRRATNGASHYVFQLTVSGLKVRQYALAGTLLNDWTVLSFTATTNARLQLDGNGRMYIWDPFDTVNRMSTYGCPGGSLSYNTTFELKDDGSLLYAATSGSPWFWRWAPSSPNGGVANDCTSSPCQNGGTCTPSLTVSHSYTCSCSAGYNGARCEVNINECASNPCQNGGLCADGVASYTCTCITVDSFHIYSGPNCATVHAYELTTPLYNGQYISATLRRQDMYPEDYIGRNVTVGGVQKIYTLFVYNYWGILRQRGHWDPQTLKYVWEDNYIIGTTDPPGGVGKMELHPFGQLIQYDANNQMTSWPCSVNFPSGCKRLFIQVDGWIYVEDCDTRMWYWSLSPTDSEYCNLCLQNPCQHGGTCTNIHRKSYTCACPPGYGGTNCETDLCTTCPGGAICVRNSGSVTCKCGPNGYPCYNGATCTDTGPGGSFKCTCPLVAGKPFYAETGSPMLCENYLYPQTKDDTQSYFENPAGSAGTNFYPGERRWLSGGGYITVLDIEQNVGIVSRKFSYVTSANGMGYTIGSTVLASNTWGCGQNFYLALQGDKNACLYPNCGCTNCWTGGSVNRLQLRANSGGGFALVDQTTNPNCRLWLSNWGCNFVCPWNS